MDPGLGPGIHCPTPACMASVLALQPPVGRSRLGFLCWARHGCEERSPASPTSLAHCGLGSTQLARAVVLLPEQSPEGYFPGPGCGPRDSLRKDAGTVPRAGDACLRFETPTQLFPSVGCRAPVGSLQSRGGDGGHGPTAVWPPWQALLLLLDMGLQSVGAARPGVRTPSSGDPSRELRAGCSG